jgi:hypothetical protein
MAKAKKKEKSKSKEKASNKAKGSGKDRAKAKAKSKDKAGRKDAGGVQASATHKGHAKAPLPGHAADSDLAAGQLLGILTEPSFPKALCPADFKERPVLTRELLSGIETWLDERAFHDKAAAMWPLGAWRAMRSHPAALWADLAQLDPAILPGRAGLCVGDAHFDNFGFVQLPGQRSYLYGVNDLDDGGVGPVALDALKYFAVLGDHPRLQGYLDLLIERYVSVLGDPRLARRLPSHLVPSPHTVLQKKLEKYVADRKIRIESLPYKTVPLDGPARIAVQEALETAPQLRGSKLLDAVDQYKLAGGSYDEDRHWVLLDRGDRGGLDLVEFKEMTVAAASFGPLSRPMTQWQRIKFLKQMLWQSTSDADYFVARLAGRDFLVRSRFHKASLAPLEMTNRDDMDCVLEAQVSILAALHRPAFPGVALNHLAYWLHESSLLLAARWRALISSSQSWLAHKP